MPSLPCWAAAGAVTLGMLALAGCASDSAQVGAAPDADDAPTVLFLGDSYTAGTALPQEDLNKRWADVLADSQGWESVNAGCNGSGYARAGLECGTSYLERIPSLADTAPDLIIVSGGVNDLGHTADDAAAAVTATYQALAEQFPDADIVGVNAIYYEGTQTPELMTQLNVAVEAAVTEVGGVYLDIGEPLLGHPELMAPDRAHPNVAGHAVIADLTAAQLTQAGIVPSYSPG